MVVDDDAGMRHAMEQLLLAAGFDVSTFRSGEEFLAAAPTASFLILDVHLPGLSGFDVCERVRPTPGQPPVIFITAHDSPASRDRAQRLAAAAYFTKPFAGRSLLAVLNRTSNAEES